MVLNINCVKDIPEVKTIQNSISRDERGYFNKMYFKELSQNLNFFIDEVFYSVNKKNVIRGIHYQNEEEELEKIITCVDGEVLDFFIDLRKSSKNYGKHSSITLSSDNKSSVYIPKGFGHGFSVLSENATVLYLQSGNYNADAERGVNPLSVDFDWQVDVPIMSQRDLSHPDLENLK